MTGWRLGRESQSNEFRTSSTECEHLGARGNASYASRDNGWLFPGGIPGRPLQTENVRAQLVEIGIKPHDNRKTALFQLAATIPTPVLADLVGIPRTPQSVGRH